MRFRTSIDNMPTFYRLVQAIEKLQTKCVFTFSKTEMTVTCNNEANEGGIQAWSTIKVPSLFTSYRIESKADNTITVLLSPGALLAALRVTAPSSAAEDVEMKLVKKNNSAALNFEVGGMTRTGYRVRASYDVRVDVLMPEDADPLTEPQYPVPNIYIALPPLQKLRAIVERMRLLSDDLLVHANGAGRLVLSISTESVVLDTTLTDCATPQKARDEDAAGDPEEVKALDSVRVSLRGLLNVLNSHVVPTAITACICDNQCVLLYVYLGDVADACVTLTFCIPASSSLVQ
ncbi:hypothetical protein PLICRDRAFT_157634 [Plicaturopsis crispa FD-325 SS-3]|nr:hypothetical protein PLICRDRAFT_157634 [Plicaturopsis crispa FD-325 SS-3]